MIFLLYVPTLFSFSFFLLFKKYIHFLSLIIIININVIMHVLNFSSLSRQIGFIENIGKDIEGCVTYTKTFDFKNIIDGNDNNINDDEDDCWSRTKLVKGRGNFPPPISSLNEHGQSSFVLLPVRVNGRLQLNKVEKKRPQILNAIREDGRLRLFLSSDHRVETNTKEEEEKKKEEQQQEELVNDDAEEQFIVDSSKEHEDDDDEVVEEINSDEQKDICIKDLKFSNERYRKCHEVLNHIPDYYVHGSNHQLHMYGFCMG